MTLPRQPLHAALAAALLAVAPPTFAQAAEPLGGGRDYVGPPTAAEQAAADAAAAKAMQQAASAAAKPPVKAPPWLAPRPPQKAAAGKNAMPGTGRMVGLVLVLATLGLATLYFKRRGKAPGKPALAPKRLSVLTSTRIGPKAHAVILSVNGRQMLLGVTDSSVKRLALLDELEEDEREARFDEREPERRLAAHAAPRPAARAMHAAAPQPVQGRSFAELLKTAFKKREPESELDAASVLAAETQDVVGGALGGGRSASTGQRMLDVEGQAQGLVRRLSAVSSTGPRA